MLEFAFGILDRFSAELADGGLCHKSCSNLKKRELANHNLGIVCTGYDLELEA